MELKNYIAKLKNNTDKEAILLSLTVAILEAEEVLIEQYVNTPKVIEVLKNILRVSFSYCKENKIEVNNDKTKDLDLDYWKNNIQIFKTKSININKDIFFYSIRNSLMFLIKEKKEKLLQKAYIFEIIIKTFLFIDFLNLSIDVLLSSDI
jgi:hypothetical protein